VLHDAQHILEPGESLTVVETVAGDADVAERAPRGALGVRSTHPLCAESFSLEVQVRPDLVLEIALRAAAEHQALSGV
jgi:hypothetical protein